MNEISSLCSHNSPYCLRVDDLRIARLLQDRDNGKPAIERTSILRGYQESGEGLSAGLEDSATLTFKHAGSVQGGP